MDDCGGGYSESIAEMCDELQNGSRCGVVWCVTGESVDDCGRGYSESIAEMSDELQNGSRCVCDR